MPLMKNRTQKQLNQLKKQWQQLQKQPEVFAYTLNVTDSKYLSGKKSFYTELNEERSSLRRPPQTITSLNPPFDENKFNFKLVNPLEIMARIPFGSIEVAMIINKSPLTKYHTLICPDLDSGLMQRLTPESLEFSVKFLRAANDNKFRIGYNSPGALASVNHLHLHLVRIPRKIYIDDAKLEKIADDYIYRLSKDMPTEAICFVFNQKETEDDIQKKLRAITTFIDWLIQQNMPHNLFMTIGRSGEFKKKLKVFVHARKEYCVVKDLQAFNVGFCELAGYVPVGAHQLFNTLTDEQVIAKICAETGDVYPKIYEYFSKLVEKNKTLTGEAGADETTSAAASSAASSVRQSMRSSAYRQSSKPATSTSAGSASACENPTTHDALNSGN